MDNMLAVHKAFDADEARDVEAVRKLIRNHPDCFWRNHFDPGHVTGSGLLVSCDGSRVLLNHHKFLKMWIGFGGHADGETDILSVCRREIIEESGIANIEPLTGLIEDVSIHPVPENPKKGEPAHRHFDIRYIFRVKEAGDEDFVMSDESLSLRWCSYDEAMTLIKPGDKISRLLNKWKKRCGV